MILLIAFAFLAGFITILSPCILPILPIVLSGTVSSGKRKPLGIVTGFVLSFTFFTLFLAAIVKATGLPADSLRAISIIIILLFGISLLLPQFQVLMEKLFTKLSGRFVVKGVHEGFGGGLLIGLSLGLVWTPCVGPIIASVITLAATSTVNFAAFFITFAYALGSAIPMFAIMYGGRGLLQRIPWLLPNTEKIQKAFGVLMILTAIGIYFNIDRSFQTYILDKFPQYGVGLTSIEDNDAVKNQLEKLKGDDTDSVSNESAPELIQGGDWFNSEPLKIKELKGKVVLVDFWTYTCINCIRTLPYLRSWHEKYSDNGLVIIGVHTPEFAFERESNNVKKAIEDFDLKYPVMQDNEYETWEAYNNRYWPAKYLVNKDGEIVYTHFGEGDYEVTEAKIQELLKEAGQTVTSSLTKESDSLAYNELSPETYLGSRRMLYLMGSGKAENGVQDFDLENNVSLNKFSLGGEWKVADEYSQSSKNAVLEYNFSGQKVFLVMKPTTGKGTVKVLLDGKVISSEMSGVDVKNGVVAIDKDRLYELVDLSGKVGKHILRLEFQTSGVQVYAFTFG